MIDSPLMDRPLPIMVGITFQHTSGELDTTPADKYRVMDRAFPTRLSAAVPCVTIGFAFLTEATLPLVGRCILLMIDDLVERQRQTTGADRRPSMAFHEGHGFRPRSATEITQDICHFHTSGISIWFEHAHGV